MKEIIVQAGYMSGDMFGAAASSGECDVCPAKNLAGECSLSTLMLE